MCSTVVGAVLCGVFSTMGGYHEYHGDITSTMGVFSTMGISSVLGGVQYHGGNLLLFENPHGAEHPPRYS